MFGICRVPQRTCDRLTTHKSESPYSRSVVVLVRDWIYAVNVIDESNDLLDFETIEERIRDVVSDVERRLALGDVALPIGALSSEDRDSWAAVGGFYFPSQ